MSLGWYFSDLVDNLLLLGDAMTVGEYWPQMCSDIMSVRFEEDSSMCYSTKLSLS